MMEICFKVTPMQAIISLWQLAHAMKAQLQSSKLAGSPKSEASEINILSFLDKWNHPCAWQVDFFVQTNGCCQPKVRLD